VARALVPAASRLVSTHGVPSVQSLIHEEARPYNGNAMTDSVVVSDADIMNGIPCFRGTRVPFKNLIDYLEGGHSLGEFLQQFPTVTREMAIQALEEAKGSLLANIA